MKLFHAGLNNFTYIKHNYQSGQSVALLSGVEASKSDWIVTLDGDGQNDPIFTWSSEVIDKLTTVCQCKRACHSKKEHR